MQLDGKGQKAYYEQSRRAKRQIAKLRAQRLSVLGPARPNATMVRTTLIQPTGAVTRNATNTGANVSGNANQGETSEGRQIVGR